MVVPLQETLGIELEARLAFLVGQQPQLAMET